METTWFITLEKPQSWPNEQWQTLQQAIVSRDVLVGPFEDWLERFISDYEQPYYHLIDTLDEMSTRLVVELCEQKGNQMQLALMTGTLYPQVETACRDLFLIMGLVVGEEAYEPPDLKE